MLDATENQKIGGYSKEEIVKIQSTIYQQNSLLKISSKKTINFFFVQSKEEEAAKMGEALKIMEQNASTCLKEKNDNSKNKKILKELKKDLLKLKDELFKHKGNKKERGSSALYQQKLNESLKKEKELQEKLTAKEKKIKELTISIEKKQNEKNLQNIIAKEEIKPKVTKKEKPPKKIVQIVIQEELTNTMAELRLNLIQNKVPFNKIKQDIFESYNENDTITLYELSKIFKRQPIWQNFDLFNLARHLIEAAGTKTRELNELAEERVFVVSERLFGLLGEYEIFTNEKEEMIKRSIEKKFSGFFEEIKATFGTLEKESGFIELDGIEQMASTLDLNLTKQEIDYCALILYKESKNIGRLPYNHLFNVFKDMEGGGETDRKKEENEEKNEECEEKKEEKNEEYEEKFDPDEKCVDINEDEMIEIAQKCFNKIAEKLVANKLSIQDLFKDVISEVKVEDEVIKVIKSEDFLNGIKKLEIQDFNEIDQACLQKVLASNEDEGFIRVADLNQILEEYAGQNDGDSGKKQMNFEELDKVSLVLMLGLAEYLVKANANLYSLFEQAISKFTIEKGEKKKDVDAMESKDFFGILCKIGLKTEDEEHENLKKFLCLGEPYSDKISVKKLKKAIVQFATNEELREIAQKSYFELIGDEDEEEEQEDNYDQVKFPNVLTKIRDQMKIKKMSQNRKLYK